MPVVKVTFTDEEYNHLLDVEKKLGCSKAEYVRNLYFEGKKISSANENIDFVTDIIEDRLRAILDPQVERLASISAKGAIMSASSNFLNAQALAEFIPVDKRRDFDEAYKKARMKGIAYVKNRINDEEEIKEGR